MFLATSNKAKGILHLNYIGTVGVEELQSAEEEIKFMLAGLPAGLKIFVDLEHVESMDLACAESIGKMMEVLEKHGVALVVRLIPDPTKDIGFNIISRFHYQRIPRTVTCQTMAEAAALLSL